MNAQTRNCVLTIGAIAAVLAGTPAAAQVWRCGATYSGQPCEGGHPMTLQDGRSSDQRTQAERAARRDARLADTMERDRLQHEARLDKALRTNRKTKPARGGAHPDDDVEAWDFEPPVEPVVARVPKPAASAARPHGPRETSGRATINR